MTSSSSSSPGIILESTVTKRMDLGIQVEIIKPAAPAAAPLHHPLHSTQQLKQQHQQPFVDLGYDSLHSTPKQLHRREGSSQNTNSCDHQNIPPNIVQRQDKMELESNEDTDDNASNASYVTSFRWTDGLAKVKDFIVFKKFRLWKKKKNVNLDEVCDFQGASSNIKPRIEWDKKLDFLLSIIGFAVDLANVWRFPYLCYKNGGGVFLIPYTIMLVFGALPLFFMELALGQFTKTGPIAVWTKICPAMKGVGYCCVLISWYVSFYYNVIIGWTIFFIFTTLTSEVMTTNHSVAWINRSSPAQEFFERRVLQINQSSGFTDMGSLRPELVACCFIVFIMLYFSLFKGVKSSGKVVWVTATAPYIILTILLIRGIFLPGAVSGILYYLNPQLEKLGEPSVWIDAAVQVFFSIGVGFGVHLTYASFNKFNNNCYTDALLTCCVNSLTSFYSGFVIFAFLGYMAESLKKDIANVASEGYGLVFQVYPEAISTLPFARFWCLLFFFMLVTLGLDSAMGGLEAVITGLMDEFQFRNMKRETFTAIVLFTSFLGSLVNCTQGGGYTMYWFDNYSAGISLLCSALFEAIALKIYGIDRFCSDIESMIGFRPNIYWRICWKYVSPVFLLCIVISAFINMESLTFHDYQFPDWSTALGWVLSLSSVAAIPFMALVYCCRKRYSSSSQDKRNSIQTFGPQLNSQGVFVSLLASRRHDKTAYTNKVTSLTT